MKLTTVVIASTLVISTSMALAALASEQETAPGLSAVIYGKSDITVKSRTQGEVVDLRAIEGQHVKRGDLIAQVDDRQERIDRELAESEYKFAKEDLEKTSRLKKFVSEDEIRQKQSNHLKKKSVFDLKTLDVEKKKINSPIAGIVTRLYFERGETIAPGDKFAEIVQMDQLYLIANVPSTEVKHFREGAQVAFSVEGIKETFKARVVFLSPVIDASSDTVRVRLETQNSLQTNGGKSDFVLKPGMVAQLIR